MSGKIRVMIVDDAAMIREFLRTTLGAQPDIEVVATAADPFIARDKFLKLRPDVITLDIEMPRMDGLTFLKKLMAAHPTPVVMFSTRTQKGATDTIKALEIGAVDFVAKPTANMKDSLADLAEEIVSKVRSAGKAKVRRRNAIEVMEVPRKIEVDEVVALTRTPPRPGGPMVVLIGASTGGTVALDEVLSRMPANSPPIAIVQHMPQHFTEAFANRLNEKCRVGVYEAKNDMRLEPGVAVVAAGGKHMLLERDTRGYYVKVKDGPPVNRHKPSVDVLFRSGVNTAGPNSVAVIMTGMGDDGARGLLELRKSGAFTVAQNEESCVVYGMPKAAVDMDAAERVVPLDRIAPLLVGLWDQNLAKNR